MQTVIPYIIVKDGSKALDYYVAAFGAKVLERHETEDKKIMHARLQIGNALIMLSDEFPEPQSCGLMAPSPTSKLSSMLHIYSDNVDVAFQKALQHGAKAVIPVENMFWGERYGQLEDPFGHRWSISTPLKR